MYLIWKNTMSSYVPFLEFYHELKGTQTYTQMTDIYFLDWSLARLGNYTGPVLGHYR